MPLARDRMIVPLVCAALMIALAGLFWRPSGPVAGIILLALAVVVLVALRLLRWRLRKGSGAFAHEGASITLLIEYRIDGMGTPGDLDKRHALEDRMDDLLQKMGLGACDGGSIGSETMEVCCLVKDFDKARQAIEADLAGSSFAGYSRIYREDAD
jgi:hypothetical protein